jgi:hypothetical protein
LYTKLVVLIIYLAGTTAPKILARRFTGQRIRRSVSGQQALPVRGFHSREDSALQT